MTCGRCGHSYHVHTDGMITDSSPASRCCFDAMYAPATGTITVDCECEGFIEPLAYELENKFGPTSTPAEAL